VVSVHEGTPLVCRQNDPSIFFFRSWLPVILGRATRSRTCAGFVGRISWFSGMSREGKDPLGHRTASVRAEFSGAPRSAKNTPPTYSVRDQVGGGARGVKMPPFWFVPAGFCFFIAVVSRQFVARK